LPLLRSFISPEAAELLAALALALLLEADALLLAALLELPDEQPTRASAATITAMAANTMYFLAFMWIFPLRWNPSLCALFCALHHDSAKRDRERREHSRLTGNYRPTGRQMRARRPSLG
jgi:hypothetical protein